MIAREQEFRKLTSMTKRGSWSIAPALCKGCGLCIQVCPTNVITYSKDLGTYGTQRVECDASGCITCGKCSEICPDSAIVVALERKSRRSEPGD